jgi:hypothetical protein
MTRSAIDLMTVKSSAVMVISLNREKYSICVMSATGVHGQALAAEWRNEILAKKQKSCGLSGYLEHLRKWLEKMFGRVAVGNSLLGSTAMTVDSGIRLEGVHSRIAHPAPERPMIPAAVDEGRKVRRLQKNFSARETASALRC